MIKRIPDSRLVNMAAELSAMETEIIRLIDEARVNFPEACQELTECLGYVVAAHIGLKEAVDWPVPVP
jgi:hypothetical protein